MRREKGIVIDLFCGAGGESQGIHWAMGDGVRLFAVNHWQRACETHAENFPGDEVLCQSIQAIQPRDLVGNQTVELLWASPECTHFSVARGGKPMDDQSRCTPFDILRWLSVLRVKRVIIENVPEFQTWGPLGANGRPLKSGIGQYFRTFVPALQSMGYKVEWRLLNAADYGCPTTRTRFFLQAVKGKEIVWPLTTNSEQPSMFEKPWIPARDIIDWSLPCPPIEERRHPLCEATMRRIMQGVRKYWGNDAVPFITRYNGGDNRNHSVDSPMPTLDTSNRYALIVPYYGNGTASSVDKPLPTVTCKDRFALVRSHGAGIGFRMFQPHELAMAQSFPQGYRFTGPKVDVVKQIGNAVCPKMAEALVEACE